MPTFCFQQRAAASPIQGHACPACRAAPLMGAGSTPHRLGMPQQQATLQDHHLKPQRFILQSSYLYTSGGSGVGGLPVTGSSGARAEGENIWNIPGSLPQISEGLTRVSDAQGPCTPSVHTGSTPPLLPRAQQWGLARGRVAPGRAECTMWGSSCVFQTAVSADA